MAASTFMLVLASIISVVFSSYPSDCDKGPSYWCLSPKIAKRCGVSEFCEVLKTKELAKEKKIDKKQIPDAPPVNVSLYYESLCPFCKDVLKDQVFPAYDKFKGTGILNIFLYPYGNAREFKTPQGWRFQCQHGQTECDVNIIETCGLHLLHGDDKYKFIRCIETGDVYPTVHGAKKCAMDIGVAWDPIFNCFNGSERSEGNFLEHQMAEKTDNLNPRHLYVPWFTLNGVHTQEIQKGITEDMLGYVCNVYTGTKPDVCRTNGEPEHKRKRIGACYKEFK